MNSSENNIILSIIVPAYNVEKYIYRFFDCLCPQLVDEVEVIVIDDGCTDKSGNIADEYASMYGNIIVVHQENKGVSVSRNVGLDLCHGKKITFLDPDDHVSSDYIEKLVCFAKKDYTTAFSFKTIVSGKGAERTYDNILPDVGEEYPSKSAVLDLERAGIFNFLWNKVYIRSIIEKVPAIRFPAHFRHGDDLLFNCEYFSRINEAELCSNQLYYYYRQENLENTLSHKHDPELWEKTKVFMSARKKMYESLGMTSIEEVNQLYKQNLYCVIKCIPNMYRKGKKLKKSVRISFYREILNMPEIRKMTEVLYNATDRETKVFARLYSMKSATLMDVVFNFYFFVKYN